MSWYCLHVSRQFIHTNHALPLKFLTRKHSHVNNVRQIKSLINCKKYQHNVFVMEVSMPLIMEYVQRTLQTVQLHVQQISSLTHLLLLEPQTQWTHVLHAHQMLIKTQIRLHALLAEVEWLTMWHLQNANARIRPGQKVATGVILKVITLHWDWH